MCISIVVLTGVHVGGSGRPHPAYCRALMNILIMLRSASCLGFPVPSGKVNSGWAQRGREALEERTDRVRCLRTKNRYGYTEQISWEHQGVMMEVTE